MTIEPRVRPLGGLPAIGLADTAWIVLGVTLLAGFLSGERGVMFEPGPGDLGGLPPLEKAPLFVRVLPDGTLHLGGQPSSLEDLVSRARSESGSGREAVIVLHVAYDAPYEQVVALLDELRLPQRWTGARPPIVSLPTHRQIAEYARAYGSDPFGATQGPP